jgi:ribonuclease E
MGPSRHQREVENRLRDHLKVDRARVQVGRISRFGLLEMSRQRLRPSLGDAHQEVCPRCQGLGHVRGVESLGLAVLRLLEDEASRDNITKLIVQLPIPVATFMLNEKRVQLDAIERRHSVPLLLIPNPHFDTPHYEIERIKNGGENSEVSHNLMVTPEVEVPVALKDKPVIEQAAVTGVSHAAPAPVMKTEKVVEVEKKPSLLKRLLNVLTGKSPDEVEEEVKTDKVETKSSDATVKKEQQKPRTRNKNNRRGPRNNQRNDQNKAKEDSNSKDEGENKQPSSNNGPSDDDKEGGQNRSNNNARRSRRGGRRRRPRNDQDSTPIPDDAGNRLPPEKKEVNGNAIPVDKAPEVNGNVTPAEPVKEIDGNKPPPAAKENKPKRGRTSTGAPRRRPAAKKDKPAANTNVEQTQDNVKTVSDKADAKAEQPKPKVKKAKPVKQAKPEVLEKSKTSADNSNDVVITTKPAIKKVKPTEDVSET